MSTEESGLSCPSAQPDMPGAHVIGVISGTAEEPRIAYLKQSAQVPASALASLGDLAPTQVFRFAARCEEHRCVHFNGERCSLGERIVRTLDPVVDALPTCQIRPTCRWHAEQGGEACRRCPQVITMIPRADNKLNRAAMPDSPGRAL
jgi:hypothetical protein